MASERRTDLLAAAALCGTKALAGAIVLGLGFSHVSDDDYARVVIAQLFARAPKLDPSGTSWLPFPFWLQGGVMILFGRSLEVARVTAFVLGVASVLPPFAMARAAGVPRTQAAAGVLVASATAWSAWLGVATVPEALTASLAATGALALAVSRGDAALRRAGARAIVAGGACLLAASLSRYEAWPVCAVFAAAMAYRWRASRAREEALAGLLALAGPIAWMAWNAATHGDALHFFARVSRFHAAHASDVSLGARVLGYPAALVAEAPEIALLAAGAALAWRTAPGASLGRWKLPLGCAGAVVAFLVVGAVRGGAPTHHAARALLPAWWIVAMASADACLSVAGARRWAPLAAAGWLAATVALWTRYPGASEGERRDAQLARGRALRSERPAAISVQPCAFEHFALLAALGAPEIARVEPASPASECPRVDVTR